MLISNYIAIWAILALVSWVLFLFFWKSYSRKHLVDDDTVWLVGLYGCLFGMAVWPVVLPVAVLAGLGYLLYRWILK